MDDISKLNLSIKSYLTIIRERYLHIVCPLKVGLPAPNINILTLDGAKKKLLDFEKKGRPLVVNFGSCTWSPFMSNLDAFNKVVSEFGSHADFVAVYISEAHPLEGWTLKDNYRISQHTQIGERRIAAEMLKDAGISCPVVMDTMANEAIDEYAALPEALYIIEDSVVKLKCLGPYGDYNPENVRKWLQSYVKHHQ